MKTYTLKKKFYITAGILKKKHIQFSSTKNIKPTKSNIKKILYTFISKYKNIYMLELFSGTGIISFDSFSNNCEKNILIEKDKKTYQNILINKRNLINSDNFKVYLQDSYIWLQKTIILNTSIIIFDAPYNMHNISTYLAKLNKIIILKKYTIIFFENNKKLILKNIFLNYFVLYKNKKGNVNIYIMKKIL